MTEQQKHCGSCRHLDESTDLLDHNKRGWYRCKKVVDAVYMVHALKAVKCSVYQKVSDIEARRNLLRMRKNG